MEKIIPAWERPDRPNPRDEYDRIKELRRQQMLAEHERIFGPSDPDAIDKFLNPPQEKPKRVLRIYEVRRNNKLGIKTDKPIKPDNDDFLHPF